MILFIDKKLLQYQWYRSWQANRSRKRLEKRLATGSNKVESYDSTAIAQREEARYQKLLEQRRLLDAERQQQAAQELVDIDKAETMTKLNPGKTEEIYQQFKITPPVNRRHKEPYTDEELRVLAFEQHLDINYTLIQNERDATKS